MKKQGKVVPLATQTVDDSVSGLNANQWLHNKFRGAASIDDGSLLLKEESSSYVKKHSGVVRSKKVRYQGVLHIEDVSMMKDILIRGIGREKAYGCGLVTLAPCN